MKTMYYPPPWTQWKTFSLFALLVALCIQGCAGENFLTPVNLPQEQGKTLPKLQVYIMPQKPVCLKKAKVLMVPVFMQGTHEKDWSKAVSNLIHSILLQENLFHTLVLANENTTPQKDFLTLAKERGFDYILEIVMPPVLEAAGNSPGWVGMTLYLKDSARGYTLWQIYGETRLVPQPTYHKLWGRQDAALAPTSGQGIVCITRAMARIMKQGACSSGVNGP